MSDSRPVCIVTGGSEGVGRATVLHFARAGYDVVTCARRRAPLAALAREAAQLGAHCHALPLDLREREAGAQLVEAAVHRFGHLDVVVNNAGYAQCRPIVEVTDEAAERTLAVNVGAVFSLTRASWPHLRARGGGVIVNVSSLAAYDPFPGLNVYGAAKAWVNLFTKTTAQEGRPAGIRAYAVALGAVDTPMLRGLFPDFPLEEALSAEQVAEFILGLCDPVMAPASGQTLLCKR